MLHLRSGGGALDETSASLFSEIARMIRDEIDLLAVSSQWHVNPTTLRRILEGRPVSRFVEKKIRAGLKLAPLPGKKSDQPSAMERLREIHRLYQEKRSLRAVGRTMGLSREWVRKLLVKGAEIGLFEYASGRPSFPSREKILDDYRKYLRLDAVAEANRISTTSLRRLHCRYRITRQELATIRSDRLRKDCIDIYLSLVQQIGHHPTTTELRRLKLGRSLHWQIRKRWGSIEVFRSALNVPSPPMRP